ncbi:methyltransferase type 11 [Spartobacteria bacterium LR76]|nr:methyltransferase type 11 [Spartobacteria bacterium LR76]
MGKLVNVGCGCRIHPDWVNLDLHASVPGVIVCDLTRGLPLADGEAEVVYSAAVLEHVRRENVPAFLAECRRVLKPKGYIRLAVPDFERQARVYLECIDRLDRGDAAADADHEWMMVEIFDQIARERSGGEMGDLLGRPNLPNERFIVDRIGKEGSDLIKILKGSRRGPSSKTFLANKVPWGRLGQFLLKKLLNSKDIEDDLRALEIGRFRLLSGEVHQWAYDRYEMMRVLRDAGFRSIMARNHGESEIPRWAHYHLEVDEAGVIEKPDLMVIEARKA